MPPGLPCSSAATTKLSQIEQGLRQDVKDLVQQQVSALVAEQPGTSSGSTKDSARLDKLESSVQEMRHQNQKFEEWFQKFGHQVQQQQAEIAQVRQEVTAHTSAVQASVKSAVAGMQQEVSQSLGSQLAQQMEQIQALLAKKQRQE